jgi:hypothetical protein
VGGAGPVAELVVKYSGSEYTVALPASALVADLQTRLAELTQVPPAQQRLLYKGSMSLVGRVSARRTLRPPLGHHQGNCTLSSRSPRRAWAHGHG